MATRDTYEIQTWENAPQETSPLSAGRLTHIEHGIKDAMDNRALKTIYNDDYINLGEGNTAGLYNNIVSGQGNILGYYSYNNIVSGQGNTVDGAFSSVFGYKNIAKAYQHIAGMFNKNDDEHNYAEMVGNGDSETERSNARTLDWQGNAWFAGDVTNGQGVSLNSLKSDIDNMEIIAEGGAIAKVFNTKDELDAWLLIDGNAETLTVGQNIYIVETDTPDYWWDGTELQVLETDAVEIESMSYEETMAVLNATAEGAI